jgi:uncharacterized repeat protein (TIGR01451 family)
MQRNKTRNQLKKLFSICAVVLFILAIAMVGTATAKSVYVIANINANPSPIQAYDIQADQIVYQATYNVPYYGWGAVGLAVDTDSEYLFVTYEMSSTIQLVDATTMTGAGTVTAPGAQNLAGIVVDQDLQKLYTVDRYTDNFYVYDWDASGPTLTLDAQYDLPGIGSGTVGGAFGIALDEINDVLYVVNNTTTVHYYNTSDFSTLAGTLTLTANRNAIGIAIDYQSGLLYTGAGWYSNYYLNQYNLATSVQQEVYLGSGEGVMGLSVDNEPGTPSTGMVYCSTGYSGDRLRVFNSSLVETDQTGGIGNPTGVVVPGRDIGYNPLNLSKVDTLPSGACALPHENLTYEICYDNTLNNYPVGNVEIVDTLPPEVSYVSDTGSGNYNAGTHTVEWDIGTLPAGDPGGCLQLVVQVGSSATPGSIITNVCTIDSDETPPTTKTVQTDICCPLADLWAVEYRWGAPPPGYSWSGLNFTGWLEVRIENQGSGDAYNVEARLNSNHPKNMTIHSDPEDRVTLGNIPAGSSAWSTGDTFTVTIDMGNPQNPNEGWHWDIEYDDECGNHHVIYDVPEFPWCPLAPSLDKLLPENAQLLHPWYPQLTVSKLHPNYPNPFNPETWIPYQIAKNADVTVRIFDLKGHLIRTMDLGYRQAGFYISKDRAVHWDGRTQWGEKVSSGVYFYTLQADKFTETRKMLILK